MREFLFAGRTDVRPSCPPPISLKQSQQNMSTRSKYTPLKRGVATSSGGSVKPDLEKAALGAAADVKTSSTTEEASKPEKAKSKVYEKIIIALPCAQDFGLTQVQFLQGHDVDVEIRQAQAKPLSLLLTYTLLIHVPKLPIKLTLAPGSVQSDLWLYISSWFCQNLSIRDLKILTLCRNNIMR